MKRLYLVGDSGRIVHVEPDNPVRIDGCAGATLAGAFKRSPGAWEFTGLNGEQYSRFPDFEVYSFRAQWGYVCGCEATEAYR